MNQLFNYIKYRENWTLNRLVSNNLRPWIPSTTIASFGSIPSPSCLNSCIIWINPFQYMSVRIAANWRINPAVSVCSLLVLDQPLSSLSVWIAATCGSTPFILTVWIASRCGSTPHIYCLCGSPLTVDNSLVSPSIRIALWLSILHSNLSLRLPWFSLRNGECNEAVAPSTAPFSSD